MQIPSELPKARLSRKKKKEMIRELAGEDSSLLMEALEEVKFSKRKEDLEQRRNKSIFFILVFFSLFLFGNLTYLKFTGSSTTDIYYVNSWFLIFFSLLYFVVLVVLRYPLRWDRKVHYCAHFFIAAVQMVIAFLIFVRDTDSFHFLDFVEEIKLIYAVALILALLLFNLLYMYYPYFVEKAIRPELWNDSQVYATSYSEENLSIDDFLRIFEKRVLPYSTVLKKSSNEVIYRIYRLMPREFVHLGIILRNNAIGLLVFDADQEIHQSEETMRRHNELVFEWRCTFSLKHATRQTVLDMKKEMETLLILFGKRFRYAERLRTIISFFWEKKILYMPPVLVLIFLYLTRNFLWKAILDNAGQIIAAIITSATAFYIFFLGVKMNKK